MRNVSGKSCRENGNTLFMPNNIFFSKILLVFDIKYKKNVEPYPSQMKTRRMRTGCWTPNATNTHSQYVEAS